MSYLLLLVNPEGEAITSRLVIRQLREFPGGEGLSVHFRPVRNDLLFESAKIAGRLAYRILSGEGVVRSQLWVEYEVPGNHINVTGRSSDLLFALALITSKWKKADGRYPAMAATGVLDAESASLASESKASVQGVKHTVEKVAAAVSSLANEPTAVIFYPAADAENVSTWSASANIPAHIRLHPVESLEDALAILGISLEKVYLGNPFRGLEHFDYQHRAIFFGRDAEVSEVLGQLLRREASGTPGLLVEGASGSGKSSFLRAGILPALVNPGSQRTDIEQALRIRPVPDSVRWAIWRVGLLRADANEAQLARTILDCWQRLPEFAGCLCGENLTLLDLVEQRRRYWPSDRRFVWLLDQFEELFTQELPEPLIDRFGRFLIALQSDRVWTLASIRADAVPKLKQHQSLRQVFGSNEGNYYLATIAATALDDVINRPAQAAGLSFGMGPSGKRLDQALREDAYRDHENALPLLQFTLHELFQRRLGKELTYVAYEQLGGLAGSVATTADAVLKAEGLEDRTVSHLFRNLISVDDAGGASRRYARMAEIEEDPAQRRLLLRLVEARLCVSDQREGEAVVAIAHEAMLRTWPVLVEWLKQEAGLLQTRELAQRETRLWQQHGQFDDWLAAADKLAAFKQLETDGIALSEPVRNFIARSAQRERRATRIKQASVGAIALLAIFASVAGWVASRKQHEAEYQTSEALHAQARLLTEAAAQRLSDNDLAGAQGIILEVLRDPKYAARSNPDAINVFQEMRAADKQIAVLSGHTGFVEFAAYSPDGARIVTASDDKTARIWDARSGKQLAILSGHEGAVNHVTYSPDGNRIVTASNDKTTRVWDARTGAQLLVLVGHDAFVNFAVYSTDGARIVTASDDKTARIWDARTGLQLAVLSGHGSSVRSAMFAPDGTHVVTASHDYTARIWDARSGAQLAVLSAGPALLESAAYSPDGARIVTTSRDKTARLWDAHTRAPLHVLTGHGTAVMSAAFSPDAGRIVTVSFDRTIRFWDSNTGVQLGVLSGHGDRIHSVAFSPDGTRIVTASFDKTARVWDARPDARIAMLSVHPGNIGSAKYSPDGTRILLASNNETASIWDARTNSELAVLSGHGGVEMAGYSSDGTRVVTASTDKTAGVWDAVTGTRLGTLSGHAGQVECAAYSPDGTHIVTASDDTTARVWDAHTFAPLAVLTGHTASVRWAVYSRDGSRIVTASWDKTARVWDARTGALIAVLAGHSGSVSSIDYSPDGRSIATASYDRTGRIWDAHTFAPLAVLSGHRGVVESVAYSPDGSRIVTASMDKTVRVWDAVTGTQLAVLAGHDDLIETAAFSPDASRIVSASDDGTARIWDARAAADINAQILWEAAAQTDPLSDIDRNKLGLTRDSHARSWSGEQSACDQAAAAYYDPDRDSPGVATASIAPDVANSACSAEIKKPEHSARMDYQMGRVLIAKRDVRGARQLFERAVSKGYRVARIDLADLQKDDSSGEIDVVRAVALYARAWKDHVPLAAYELGHLYETGAPSAAAESHSIAHPDLEMAWSWYQKGANAGEPTALARFAERDEMNALLESDASKRSALLLQAFRYYAAAAERARNENWPDDAWRHWRYRRATLARLLAREGMMQQVAGAYATARNM